MCLSVTTIGMQISECLLEWAMICCLNSMELDKAVEQFRNDMSAVVSQKHEEATTLICYNVC